MRLKLSMIMLGLFYSLSSQALVLPLPAEGNDIVGSTQIVEAQPGDTLASIGDRYDIGLQEMREANFATYPSNRLKSGDKIIVPTQFILPSVREGIVVNLAELRLYYFLPDHKEVMTFPIAIGRLSWQTPIMMTRVVGKQKDPHWYVPKSIKEYTLRTKGKLLPNIMPPGPENPLGKYKLQLAMPGYLIHGTNVPSSVGTRVSSGCIRMSAQGIESLYNNVQLNTPVHIINQSIKAGWLDNKLYLEAQWPLRDYPMPNDKEDNSLKSIITKVTQTKQANINWQEAENITNDRTGIPQLIGDKHWI
jgi:L,D-transpeptidase ErfK/SrfK